jgi:O-antigen ligase
LNLLAIFTSLFLFCWGGRKIRIAQFNRVLPLAAASLPLISILWSVAPDLTFTRGLAYFFVVLGAIGLVKASDGDELMDLVTLICGLSALASIVQFFIFPEPGDFRGIFSQKNVLGQVMVGGVLAGLHGARTRNVRPFRYICVIALCTIVAFMSKSATSVLTILLLLWLDMLGRFYLKGGPSRIMASCLAIVSIIIAIIFVVNADLIFDFLGKDSTLTGRTLIWPYVIDSIGERPILGWGFCAFWSPANPFALQLSDMVGWSIPNAHSGILEFLLQIGFLGTALFLVLWLRNFVLAVKCMHGPAGQFGVSSVLLLIGILVIGVSEEVLLTPQQIWTNLFFMMGFICEKQLWLARATRRQVRTASAMTAANLRIRVT